MLNPFLVVLIKKKECTYGNMGIVIQGHSLDEILDSPLDLKNRKAYLVLDLD